MSNIVKVFTLSSILVLTLCPFASRAQSVLGVVEQTAGRVDFYDTKTYDHLSGLKVGEIPHEIAISPDEKTAYVTNFGLQDYDETIGKPGHTVSVIDIPSATEKYRLSTGDNLGPHGIKVRPGHSNELYVNTEINDMMLVFDLRTGAIKRRFPIDSKTHNFIFSPDGSVLWLMATSNGIIKINPESGKVLATKKYASPVRGIKYTPSNKNIMASYLNSIIFIDPITLKTTKTFNNLGVTQILYSDITPNGRYIVAPAVWNDEVIIIDTDTKKVVKRIPSGIDPVKVVIDGKGKYAYISNARDSHVSRINLDNFSLEQINVFPGPNGLALLKRPDGVAKDTLTLGVALPLSGSMEKQGREMMLGYTLWKNDINASGGLMIGGISHQIKLVYQDTRSDSKNIGRLTKKLIHEDGVKILLSTLTPYGLEQERNVAVKNKIALIPTPVLEKGHLSNKLLYNRWNSEKNFSEYYYKAYNLKPSILSTKAYTAGLLAQKMLSKNLYIPQGKGPFPGVILIHGSGGITAGDTQWAQELQSAGYAVYLEDSFTARNIKNRKSVGWDGAYNAQMADIPNAFALLSGSHRINSDRVGILGFSLGGYTTLKVMLSDWANTLPIKVGASFYGHCQLFGKPNFHHPVKIFIGDDDDRTPLSSCLALANTNSNLSVVHYKNAKHGFDNPIFPKSLTHTSETGEVYHLGYNAQARSKAKADLLRFLKREL